VSTAALCLQAGAVLRFLRWLGSFMGKDSTQARKWAELVDFSTDSTGALVLGAVALVLGLCSIWLCGCVCGVISLRSVGFVTYRFSHGKVDDDDIEHEIEFA
jgi:hypothetical protein